MIGLTLKYMRIAFYLDGWIQPLEVVNDPVGILLVRHQVHETYSVGVQDKLAAEFPFLALLYANILDLVNLYR